ncbi:MAG: prolyl oligopeptidase family serine peptidase [Alphaproteobacteria bacterium GM202ARS2]|nr:prolyl oligopeptidase family serine peptidase [Alphaproteobacteria bacterium GM202ARS2]
MQFALNTYTLKPKQQTDSLVILLHGYGADGQDMLPIINHWQADLPRTLFIVPDAPFPCEVNPSGKQWFSLQPFNLETITQQANQHKGYMAQFIEDALSQAPDGAHVPSSRLILAGFSQGGMFALHVGLTLSQPVGGIIGYSCALANLEAEEIRNKPPVLLVHGEQDDVVPYHLMQQSAGRLKENGIETTTLSRANLAHSIDQQGLTAGRKFIQQCLHTS